MNVTLDISSAGQGLAAAQTPSFTSAETKPEENATGAIFTGMRPSLWHASAILKVLAGILVALYVFGASALSAALLLYTFTR
jgi:hypothetical protein